MFLDCIVRNVAIVNCEKSDPFRQVGKMATKSSPVKSPRKRFFVNLMTLLHIYKPSDVGEKATVHSIITLLSPKKERKVF